MKSRVNKNMELHQSLSMSFEAETPSKDLSHYANKLNEIDDQFRRVEVDTVSNHHPQRARVHDKHQESKEDIHVYDTFENTYLKDFLNEVKEYNVKKGYRKFEDTQSNIVTDLNINNRLDHDEIRSVLRDMNFDDYNEVESIDETKVFNTVDLNEDLDSVISSLDETIALNTIKEDPINFNGFESKEEVRNIAEESILVESDSIEPEVLSEDLGEGLEENAVADDVEELVEEEEVLSEDSTVTDHLTVHSNLDDTFKRSLLEQTQTLQYKIIDQERNIEDMNNVMIRTNRLLHAVISILLLAIFVVIILVVAQLVA